MTTAARDTLSSVRFTLRFTRPDGAEVVDEIEAPTWEDPEQVPEEQRGCDAYLAVESRDADPGTLTLTITVLLSPDLAQADIPLIEDAIGARLSRLFAGRREEDNWSSPRDGLILIWLRRQWLRSNLGDIEGL